MELGLLLLRVTVGLTLAAHGAQKLLGWFGGYGLAGTAGWLESVGFRPGRRHAVLAGISETSCRRSVTDSSLSRVRSACC